MKAIISPRSKQTGVTMVLVLVLMIIAVSASLYFQERMISSTRISGASRDNSASLMMAESAMEYLRGGFINTLDSHPSGNGNASCEIDGASVDSCEAYGVISNMSDAEAIETTLKDARIDYIFYVGSAGISRNLPSILQGVANGGATASDGTFCTMSSRVVSNATCNLRINDLFGEGYGPRLYTVNGNGLLIDSSSSSWNGELARDANINGTVAAAWLELTANTDESNAVDIWVQAAAQVGAANSYVQRYVGTFYPSNQLGSLAALIEASNIDRRN